MPTILVIRGWRLFVYTNEGNEPPHVHVRKGGAECKYWLYPDRYDIEEDYSYNLNPADRRAVRQIIFDHFDYIVAEYKRVQRRGE